MKSESEWVRALIVFLGMLLILAVVWWLYG